MIDLFTMIAFGGMLTMFFFFFLGWIKLPIKLSNIIDEVCIFFGSISIMAFALTFILSIINYAN